MLRWIGGKSHGYGCFKLNGRAVAAHRIAYTLWGEDELIPSVCVLHKNDDPDCVDPRFLFLGTHQDNMDDMYAKGRRTCNPRKGEDHHSAKLKTHEVLDIYQRAWRGENQRLISLDYGITNQTVNHIKKGVSWSHVTGHITSELAAAD